MQHGYVLLGGDFNARVADLSDVSSHERAFLEGSGLSSQRRSSSSSFNLHGQLLIDLYHGASLMLGKGRLADLHACATHRSGSRSDRFLMDRYTPTGVAASFVVADRFDSDHKPVTIEFPVAAFPAAAASASTVDSPVGSSAHPLPGLR